MLVFKDEPTMTRACAGSTKKNLSQVVHLAETYVQKIIQFCKSFSAFTGLSQPHQATLLKSYYPEIATICASFNYQVGGDSGLPVMMVGQ